VIGGVVIALAAVGYALAAWKIYPRLLSRSRRLRTSPVQLFFQSLTVAVIAGFGAALVVASLLPDAGADSPAVAAASAPASLAEAAPAPPPVKTAKRSAQRRAEPNSSAGSSAGPGNRNAAVETPPEDEPAQVFPANSQY
jgi:hypothetical protein